MKHLHHACMAMGMWLCCLSTAHAQQNQPDTEKISASLGVSLASAPEGAMTRVIVEFSVGDALQRELYTKGSDSARRSDVLNGRNRVLASISGSEISPQRKQLGLKRALKYSPYFAFEGTAAEIAALSRSPHVISIYKDREAELFMLPESTASNLTDAVTTRSLGFSGAGQAVAIIDSGVARNHTFIGANRVVAEACYASDCTAETGPGVGEPPSGGDFHGTHVAGIAAGSDTLALSGVAPEADILAVRVFPQSGNASFSDIAAGLEFVYDSRNSFNIASANMSLGVSGQPFGTPCGNQFDPAVTASIDLVAGADIAVVVSSGNDGSTTGISFPACVPNAISVGATNDGSSESPLCTANGPDTSGFDEVSSYSNSDELVDVLAPGSNIRSSWGTGSQICNLRGTSMAAPHVAGAFAVIKAEYPTATTSDILTAIQTTGAPVTDSRNGVTKPRLDVYAALQEFQSSPPAPEAKIVVLPIRRIYGAADWELNASFDAVSGSGSFEKRSALFNCVVGKE